MRYKKEIKLTGWKDVKDYLNTSKATITPLVVYMLMAHDNFGLESDSSKMALGETLFLF